MVTAWIVISMLSGKPILSKQVRVEPQACHFPAVKAEYPLASGWHTVILKISCIPEVN
jgi:hypothetical protein